MNLVELGIPDLEAVGLMLTVKEKLAGDLQPSLVTLIQGRRTTEDRCCQRVTFKLF